MGDEVATVVGDVDGEGEETGRRARSGKEVSGKQGSTTTGSGGEE